MLIRGEANGASIELSEQEGLKNGGGSEFYRVTLRENGFEASSRVYAFDPMDNGLHKFLASLASDWKGWEGPKSWSSLEGEFHLICTHDGIGHIGIEATLHSNPHGHGWTAQIRFDLVAGDLDKIASEAASFFDN